MCLCIDLIAWVMAKLLGIFKVTEEGISQGKRRARFLAMVATLAFLFAGGLKALGVI